jgi:hypothetical protein
MEADFMTLKHTNRLILISLLIAWAFDLLFWKQAMGISFFIFVLLSLIAGLGLALSEGIYPPWKSLILLAPILFFAAMTFIRQESFTLFVSAALTLGLMICFVLTFRNGLWLQYSLTDWIVNTFPLLGSAFLGFGEILSAKKSTDSLENSNSSPVKQHSSRGIIGSILGGLALAFPLLLVLGALLSSADPIFSRVLNNLFSFLKIENLVEYLIRAAYILALAYLLVGVFLHAFLKSQGGHLIGAEKPWLSPFLGWIPSSVVLASVNLMFALFVGIQIRYFFGGQSNITAEGFTYAEYARQGFSEMVWVVVISLLLFLGLGAVTRRKVTLQRSVFSGLGLLLLGLVIIILISAFQRLLLYENAYGFSRVRTYTHIFMIWVGILLAATVLLDLAGYLRGFGAALLLVSIGFGISLSLLNVDSLIVRQNTARVVQGEDLDIDYLITLSDDAVPTMAALYRQNSSLTIHDHLGAVLACKMMQHEQHPVVDWRSYHLSRETASQILITLKPELTRYLTAQSQNRYPMVTAGGHEYACYPG